MSKKFSIEIIEAPMTNNKQQTAMKLYTQEQLERGMDLANRNVSKKSILESLTPIELPSNEEIEKEAPYSTLGWGYEFGMNDGFKKGAKYVIDKIQGGNNEQQ
jgi:hypothetical protein